MQATGPVQQDPCIVYLLRDPHLLLAKLREGEPPSEDGLISDHSRIGETRDGKRVTLQPPGPVPAQCFFSFFHVFFPPNPQLNPSFLLVELGPGLVEETTNPQPLVPCPADS